MAKIRTIQDVADYRLCIGCGACAHVLGNDAAEMVDIPRVGIRPRFTRELTVDENVRALAVCPGVQVERPAVAASAEQPDAFDHQLAGGGLGVWEGWASDAQIRAGGSSGGVITALSLYCIEQFGVASVSHVGMHDEQPWKNKNIVSGNRDDLMRGLGSRYAASAPCLSLSDIEAADGRTLFVGKPCDAAAVALVLKQKPHLRQKIAGVISFFCAGTPGSAAAVDLLRKQGADPQQLQSVKFRGDGWPGRFRAVDGGGNEVASLSYAQSWGELQRSRGLRCSLCADGMGEVADIACGDAWHRFADDGNPGVSVVIARTRRGLEIVEGARQAGYLELEPAGVDAILASQGSDAGLIRRRSDLWGRLAVFRLLRIPCPRYEGFALLAGWLQIPCPRKLRSLFGTVVRVFRKRLLTRQRFDPLEQEK